MGGLADVQEAKRKQAVERGFKIITRLLKTSSETLRGILYIYISLSIIVYHIIIILIHSNLLFSFPLIQEYCRYTCTLLLLV